MNDSRDKTQVRPKRDIFLIVSNLVLAAFTATFLWITFSHYQNRIEAVTLSENRSLTTEWSLLQELKEQTDQQLLQKDKEIADLNRRYLSLIQGDASAHDVRQIEDRLKQAQKERKEILQNRMDVAADVKTTPGTWPQALLPPATQSALAKLLQKRIDTLQEQLKQSQLQVKTLEKERTALDAKQQAAAEEYTHTTKDSQAQIEKLSATVARMDGDIHAALKEMKQKEQQIEYPESPSVGDLDTWVLVRAIVSSPAIRSKYPDLLKSLDHYFEVYGFQERLRGQHEAYSTAEAALGSLTQETVDH